MATEADPPPSSNASWCRWWLSRAKLRHQVPVPHAGRTGQCWSVALPRRRGLGEVARARRFPQPSRVLTPWWHQEMQRPRAQCHPGGPAQSREGKTRAWPIPGGPGSHITQQIYTSWGISRARDAAVGLRAPCMNPARSPNSFPGRAFLPAVQGAFLGSPKAAGRWYYAPSQVTPQDLVQVDVSHPIVIPGLGL